MFSEGAKYLTRLKEKIKRVPTINYSDYGIDPGRDGMRNFIGSGDSHVYKGVTKEGKDIVLKIYHQAGSLHWSASHIMRYQEITKESIIYTSCHPTIKPQCFPYPIQIKIIPIQTVGVMRNKKTPCAISEFVEGMELEKFIWPKKEHEIPRMEGVFTQLIPENCKSIYESLETLSAELNKSIGTKGIHIAPRNVKPQIISGQPTFVITDLYGSLSQNIKDLN